MMPDSSQTNPQETLARIDREIQDLLKLGKLSDLEYGLEFSPEARTDRKKNLKALLSARRHWRGIA